MRSRPTMKAVVQNGYGTPEQVLKLAEIDPPAIGPDEVLIRVRATSVNTPDWITVSGEPYLLRFESGIRGPKRQIRGTDVAGTIVAVGTNVEDLRPGDSAFGSTWNGALATSGTFAEYAAVPASQVVKKPANLSFEDAAASVMSGLTALIALREVGEVRPGARILVNGASGGVGSFAVQIARTMGAEVTGVCSTKNVELVRSLGAHNVIDYTQHDFTKGAERYDVIVDNVMNHPPAKTARVLAPGGIFIPNSVGNTGGLFAGLPRMGRAALMGKGSTDVRYVKLEVTRERLESLGALLGAGIRVVVDQTYPLEKAATAVAHMLGHHARGKVVISVPDTERQTQTRKGHSRQKSGSNLVSAKESN